jgi:Family of unknown function (DUF6498)
MPLAARHVAREMQAKHRFLTTEQIELELREHIGHLPTEVQSRFIDAVAARLSGQPAAEKPVSAWVLVAANLVPLAGVILWGWDAFALIVLFWMENVIVGVFFILRMLCFDPRDPALWGAKLFMVPFFCFHYGMFTAVHGMFVFHMLGGGRYKVDGLAVLEPALRAAADLGLWLPLAVLFASHLFSFAWNYLYRGEYRRTELIRLTTGPYARVVVLHIAIILGGFGAMALGSPLWALLVLLALKIGLDLKAHLKEHSQPKA